MMKKYAIFFLILFLLLEGVSAWKPLTHVYLAKRYGFENSQFYTGALLPDTYLFANLGKDMMINHSRIGSDKFFYKLYSNVSNTDEQYIAEGYFFHLFVDPGEEEYINIKTKELFDMYPEYSYLNTTYAEVIGFAVDDWVYRKDPSILTDFLSSSREMPFFFIETARINKDVEDHYLTNTFLYYTIKKLNLEGYYYNNHFLKYYPEKGYYYNQYFVKDHPIKFWNGFMDSAVKVVDEDIEQYFYRMVNRDVFINCFSSNTLKNRSNGMIEWDKNCSNTTPVLEWVEPEKNVKKSNYFLSALKVSSLNLFFSSYILILIISFFVSIYLLIKEVKEL